MKGQGKGSKAARARSASDATVPSATGVLGRLRAMGEPASIKGRERFGIPEGNAVGATLPQIRALAKEIGQEAALARDLWRSGVHEARLLATLVMPPSKFSRAAAERWLRDVESWDLCDGLCMNLVDKTEWAYEAAPAWAASDEEWVKRAGFATIAALGVHDKEAPDAKLARFLTVIAKHGHDDRNYVKKAVSWALRTLGKARPALRPKAMETAEKLRASQTKGARWAGADALRELTRAPRVRSPKRG